MKGIMTRASVMLLVLLLAAGSAMALPLNSRPVTPGDSDLQNFLNNNISGETYDVVADQSSAALFTATGTGSVTSFVFTLTGGFDYVAGDQFGIYSAVTNMMVPIFDLEDIDTVLRPAVTVNFGDADGDGANDDVWVSSNGLPGSDPADDNVVEGVYYNFGADVFGYYTAVGQNTFYTEDDKNVGGVAQALTYQGHGGTLSMPGALADVTFDATHWLIAFETFSNVGTWADFDDLIVVAESIAPVPEPGTLLLLGGGLVGLAYLRKRKKA